MAKKAPAAAEAAPKVPNKLVPGRKTKGVDIEDDNAVVSAAVNAISSLTEDGVVKRGQVSLFLTRVVKIAENAEEVKEMIDDALASGAIKEG